MRTHRIRKEAMTRPAHLLIALLCASSLAFGAAACGSDSTSTTTTVEEQQQNDQNQNQDQNQNDNNENDNNENDNNESVAKQKEECLRNAPDPRDCEDIP